MQLHWSNYAWAAVVLGLMISLGFVLVHYMGARQENIALNQKLPEEEILEAPAREPQLISADKSKVEETPGNEKNQTPAATGPKQDVTAIKPLAAPAASTPAPAAAPLVGGNSAMTQAKEGLAKDKTESAISAPAESKGAAEMKTTAMKMKSEEKVADDESLKDVNQETAMKSFNSGDYKTSAVQFDALLKKQPGNADALYFGGISNYINEDIKKSEKNFDALLKEGTRYLEGSKWYKANILLKKGKKEEAKKLLQDLSLTGGSYKERANKKLAELEQ